MSAQSILAALSPPTAPAVASVGGAPAPQGRGAQGGADTLGDRSFEALLAAETEAEAPPATAATAARVVPDVPVSEEANGESSSATSEDADAETGSEPLAETALIPVPTGPQTPAQTVAMTPAVSGDSATPITAAPRTAQAPMAAAEQTPPTPPSAETDPSAADAGPSDAPPAGSGTPPPLQAQPSRPARLAAHAATASPTTERLAQPTSLAQKAGDGATATDDPPSQATAADSSSPAPSSAAPSSAAQSAVAQSAAGQSPAGQSAAAPSSAAPPSAESAAPPALSAGSSDAPPAPETTAEIRGSPAAGLSQLSRGAVEATAQIAAQILRRLEGRSTRFEMVLTPESLGRVDVSLDIEADGRLAARLAFDNPVAAADLRGRADELRRQLEDAGFQLTEDAFEFAERDAKGGQGFDRGRDRDLSFARSRRVDASADAAPVGPAAWISLSLTPRGVDLKV